MRGTSAIVMVFRTSWLLCLLLAAGCGTALHRVGGATWSDSLDRVSGIDAMRSPARPLLDGKWQYVYEPEKGNRLAEQESLGAEMEDRLLRQIGGFQRRTHQLRGETPNEGEMDRALYEKLMTLGYVV